ncbi:MAG: type II toxin-antitoxin system VapC family toxin [Pyrinomonadaceae bacterium]
MNRFNRDFDRRFVVVDLTPNIVELGISLADTYGLRGSDTTQLAVGLSVRNRIVQSGIQNFTFISADNDLNSAALAEDLTVENPNNHI